MTLRIRVYENSAYQDEDAAYNVAGEFTADEALRRCREMIDADLLEVYMEGMSPAALLSAYRTFGRDPFIIGVGAPAFSAWNYAARRAAELAA